MPELPEVETIVRQLDLALCGQILREIRVLDIDKINIPNRGLPLGQKLREVTRFGKQIIIGFEPLRKTSLPYIIVHLRMTGRLFWDQGQGEVPDYLRAQLCFSGGNLNFCDVRRFGTLKFADSLPSIGNLVDPTTDLFTLRWFGKELGRSSQNIKSWLLRQDRLVGIGNIYACEALFAAKIRPTRSASSLTITEIGLLHRAIKKILNQAISQRGTTFSDFQDSRGERGGYQQSLKVYDRLGLPCKRCSQPIERKVIGGRGTFFCASCQQ